jgi:hypothetical protein
VTPSAFAFFYSAANKPTVLIATCKNLVWSTRIETVAPSVERLDLEDGAACPK